MKAKCQENKECKLKNEVAAYVRDAEADMGISYNWMIMVLMVWIAISMSSLTTTGSDSTLSVTMSESVLKCSTFFDKYKHILELAMHIL